MSKILAEQAPGAWLTTWGRRTVATLEEWLTGVELSTWQRRAVALILTMTAFRLLIIATTGLTDTEAYYFSWSRVLDWSYYDHPPLVAWTAWVTTAGSKTFGAPLAFAVRVGPVAYSALSGVLIYRLGARLFSPRAGFFALLTLTVLPAVFFTSFVLNPEGILAPLWLLYLLALDGLRRGRETWRPLVIGGVVGVAFLAKYTAVLAVPVTLIFVGTTPGLRHWLRRPAFYAAGVVALAIASPVIVWNFEHHWPSVSLHLSERMPPSTLAATSQNALHLLVGQIVEFHPLVLPGLLVMMGVTLRRARHDVRFRLLAAASAPVLLFFYAVMIRVCDAESHWTLVGYVPLAVAGGAWLDEHIDGPPRMIRWFVRGVAGLSFAAFAIYFVHSQTPSLVRLLPASLYDVNADPINETIGWERVERAITFEAKTAGPDAVVVSVHNVLCGHVAVALGGSPPVYCASPRRTEFDFIGRRTPPAGAPVIYLDSARYRGDPRAALPGRHCQPSQKLDIARDGRTVSEFRLLVCSPEESPSPESALLRTRAVPGG